MGSILRCLGAGAAGTSGTRYIHVISTGHRDGLVS